VGLAWDVKARSLSMEGDRGKAALKGARV
jgi:hypothetical protein